MNLLKILFGIIAKNFADLFCVICLIYFSIQVPIYLLASTQNFVQSEGLNYQETVLFEDLNNNESFWILPNNNQMCELNTIPDF